MTEGLRVADELFDVMGRWQIRAGSNMLISSEWLVEGLVFDKLFFLGFNARL